MTVKELMKILSAYNLEAEVSCWACYVDGDPMDDASNMVIINGLNSFDDSTEEDKRVAKQVFLNVTVGVLPEDFKGD